MSRNNRSRSAVHTDALEPRRLLAASLATDGTLTITGTSAADVINVSRDRNIPSRLRVSDNGVVRRFELAAVLRISVKLLKGHDAFTLSDALSIPASVLGSGGRDTLIGGAGRDTLDGGESEDVLQGRAGSDKLLGGPQSDEISGGEGRDTLSYEYVTSTFSSGGGRVPFGVIALLDGVRNEQEADGTDVIDTTIENLTGTSFRDELTGNGSANALVGLGGGDSILGNGGNDFIDGGRGVDTLRGGSGNDTLIGGDSGDELFGNGGTDSITGSSGADTFAAAENNAGEVVDFAAGIDVAV